MITLIPATEKHIPALHSMLNEISVRQEWSVTSKPIDEKTVSETSEWLKEWVGCAYVIADNGGFVVGLATIDDSGGLNEHRRADIFVMVTKPYRAKGYGVEAIRQITEIALQHAPIATANIKDTNYRAILAFESAGYGEEGEAYGGRIRMVKHVKGN